MARQVSLRAAEPGWQLAQTLADQDEGTWQVIAPNGSTTGTVSRSRQGARTWTALAGDPGSRSYAPVPLDPVVGEAGPAGDFRTRDAAARAVALIRDPDIGDPAPPAS
jgi:hypothetical protein